MAESDVTPNTPLGNAGIILAEQATSKTDNPFPTVPK
jgi:hypothetical protein